VTVDLLTHGTELLALREEWGALCRESGATPFQSPEWLVPWWTHVAEGELLTIAVRDGRRLVGLLPLYVRAMPGGPRALSLLGLATTDQIDGIYARGWERSVVAAAFAHLDRVGDRWDLLDLHQLPRGSALLETDAPRGWASRVHPGETCRALAVGSVPWKMRKNLRGARNRAAREGARYERADERTFGALWDALLALHQERWGRGALSPGVRAAHREAMPALLRRGVLRLWVMWVGSRPAAAICALADRSTHYLYLMAFDPAFEALSPGTLVIGHAIDEAAREGARTVDFLRGDEPYKQGWGVVERPLFRRWAIRTV
jgi:CelD/BcsL family acetyltransferase involved in cellulose biosynthesis